MAKRSPQNGKWLCLSLLLLLTTVYLTGRSWQQTRTDQELLNAIQRGETERVQRLLAQGANPNALQTYSGGWSERLLLICRRKKSVYHRSALAEALQGGWVQEGCICCQERPTDVPIARLLLNAGAEVNSVDSWGQTPLMMAARARSVEGVKLLLSKGADATRKDETGRSALRYAGEGEIERLLKQAGAKR